MGQEKIKKTWRNKIKLLILLVSSLPMGVAGRSVALAAAATANPPILLRSIFIFEHLRQRTPFARWWQVQLLVPHFLLDAFQDARAVSLKLVAAHQRLVQRRRGARHKLLVVLARARVVSPLLFATHVVHQGHARQAWCGFVCFKLGGDGIFVRDARLFRLGRRRSTPCCCLARASRLFGTWRGSHCVWLMAVAIACKHYGSAKALLYQKIKVLQGRR